MSKIIGIDLGTTNSVVAVMEGGEPTVITTQEGGRLTPSVVGFTKNGERLVGQLAKRQAVSNPERTISSIKRHMGTKYTVTIDGKDYTPEQISAMILEKMKGDADVISAKKSRKRSLLYRLTSTTPSVRLRRTPAVLLVLMSRESSTNRRRLPLLMALISPMTRPFSFTTLAAGPSMFPFWNWVMASSKLNPRPVIPIWAAMTSTIASWIG